MILLPLHSNLQSTVYLPTRAVCVYTDAHTCIHIHKYVCVCVPHIAGRYRWEGLMSRK